METIVLWLRGKKTYITAFAIAAATIAGAFGVAIPDWIWPILAAVGLGSVRAAIKGNE